MDDDYVYDPQAGHGLPHDPFNAIVAPRPIGWISTRGADGVANLAPYSFFNAFNYSPPIVGFASIGWKDSVANIEATGEFAWNLVTRPLAEAMNASCAAVAPEVDEFRLAGVAAVACSRIAAPRVADSPVHFECRLTQLIRLQAHGGDALDSWLVLGQVIHVRIARRLLKDGVYDTAAAEPVLRAGGPADYYGLSTAQRFQMVRPQP